MYTEAGRLGYWFYHDDSDSSYARVHEGPCSFCRYGRGLFGSRPDLWSGPYTTAQDAWNAALAEGYGEVDECGACKPVTS